jgi:hypothetical protein
MNRFMHVCGKAAASTALILASIAVAEAAPSVWWNHYMQSIDKAACMSKAKVALSGHEAVRQISEGPDNITAWGPKTKGIIECLDHGGALMAMVLVVSDDADEGAKLFNRLETTMKK